MLKLTKFQAYLKQMERQLVDLQVANRLWVLYQNEPTLFPLLQDICGIGARISLENIALAEQALEVRDLFASPGGINIFKVGGPLFFLDCFEGREVTRKTLEDIRDTPRTIITDIGKVGGYFRFHAELAENIAKLVVTKLTTGEGPLKGRPALTVLNALLDQKRAAEAQPTTRGPGGRPPLPRTLPPPTAAAFALLSRELDGRLSHQGSLERRITTVTWEDGYTQNVTVYTGFLFKKWEGPELDNLDQQRLQERARKPREGDNTLPMHLRDFIRVPTHMSRQGGQGNSYGWVAGTSKFRQMSWDRLFIISQLYGLPPGATISGTTTDHMFAIREIISYCEQGQRGPESGGVSDTKTRAMCIRIANTGFKWLPFIQLIPLVQMVPQMHHSLAETGAAMSLNDFIHYSLGYYTTLLPEEAQSHPFFEAVNNILKEGEASVAMMYTISIGGADRFSRELGAYMCDPNKPRELAAHKAAALIKPENVVEKFESLVGPITIQTAWKKAKEIDGTLPPPPPPRRDTNVSGGTI